MSFMKHFHRFVLSAVALFTLLLGSSCEHRPLEDPFGRGRFIRVYLDENIRNVSFGFYDETKEKPQYSSPQLMRVVCADPSTGMVMSERYLHESGRDERGYYIQGYITAPDGEYDVMAYTYDAADVEFLHEYSFNNLTAYSREVTQGEADRLFIKGTSKPLVEEPIHRQPGHLFVATVDSVEFGPINIGDTIFTALGEHPVAESVVKTYYMQVNIKGAEYVKSAVALITGMAGSKTLHNNQMVPEDVVSIYFNLQNGLNRSRQSERLYVAYSSFNTFGKLPHTEGYIDITFEFKTTYSTVQTETFRVTDLFETPMVRDQQWIIIDKTIEIKPPEGETGGGLSPGVGKWEQVEGSITI